MQHTAERPLWLRLLWFVGLWAASVVALGVVAGVLRLLIHP
ncbi:DUF2474 family protein [Acetobacter persici]